MKQPILQKELVIKAKKVLWDRPQATGHNATIVNYASRGIIYNRKNVYNTGNKFYFSIH
jgi:hypothetical protein